MSKRRYFTPIQIHCQKRPFRLKFAVVLTMVAFGTGGSVQANLPAFLGPSLQENTESTSSASRSDSISSVVSPSPLFPVEIPTPAPLPTKEAAAMSSDNTANSEKTTSDTAPIRTVSDVAEKTPIISETDSSSAKVKGTTDGVNRVVTTITRLLVVLATVFALFYLMKRFSPRQNRPLPKGVIKILGQYPLSVKSRLTVLRFGSKLLLVSITGERIERLTELEDPDEIAEMESLCQAEPADSLPTFTETWIERWKRKRGTE